ncbi:MAG: VOC family protein [Parasphingopyxis sp.]|uniref:VOC family protein n=1 Tax=Parasphingopyxis sp. TaxID=1920299 RepID=UPI003FA0FFCB
MTEQARNGPVVGGIFDVCIGVPDLLDAIRYWELFGFRVGQQGALDAARADALYGVRSGARMVRLFHGDADHGLVRLIEWEHPTGPGLGLESFKCIGSRWSAALVEKVARPFAHAKYARDAGTEIRMHAPDFMPADGSPASGTAFCRPIRGAFEMAIAQPFFRQVLFERADTDNPLYGQVAPHSLMRASQFTHMCLGLKTASDSQLAFYDDVIGLKRVGDFELGWSEIGTSGKDILELAEGEGFRLVKFDDPRSGEGASKRSGRLTVFSFNSATVLPDRRSDSLPGALGHTLYTARLENLQAAASWLEANGASEMTEIQENEFGERSLLATAPDGIRWMFVDAADAMVTA